MVSIQELNEGKNCRNLPSQVPPLVQEVLNEFKDIMPPKLPKKLSLRQEVNHKSKLEQSVKQPTLTPYCIALPELKELWKQIKNIFTRLRLYSVH